MSKIPIIVQSIDSIKFTMDYIITNVQKYGLYELTNGHVADVPNIFGAHPLALEYGSFLNQDNQGNYTSILPAVGVELIDDNDNNQQYLGSGTEPLEITQDYIDELTAIALKDRAKEGITLTNTNLTSIQTAKTNKGSEKLWSLKSNYLSNQNINISCWSDNWEITRILYVVLKGILQNLKHEMGKNGARNMSISGQGAIYNYEFNQTLYGSEFNIRFINNFSNVEIDTDINTINRVDVSKLSEETKSKSTFKSTGG